MMRPLRPLTTLGTSAVTVTVTGRDDYYVRWAIDDIDRVLGKHKVAGRVRKNDTVDLTGHTVSTLVAIHKGLERAHKSATKNGVAVAVTYLGEAAGYDLATLAKEPTPAEDHATLRKVRNGSALSAAKWARALMLMGLDATPVKNGRKLVGFTLTVPGIDESTYELHYDTLRPDHCYDDEVAHEDEVTRYAAAKVWMVNAASELIGQPSPHARSGLPARARDYRTDLTIRTCPVCFRDIKASEHTHGRMADHGYTIDPGYRTGSCPGTGRLPWEQSCEPAVEEISNLLAHAAQVEARLTALEGGKVTELTVRGAYNWKTRNYATKTVTPTDEYKWEKALASEVLATRRNLAVLWSDNYGSIPWMRMTVRTWEPVPDTTPAVGAPNHPVVEADYAGKPEVL